MNHKADAINKASGLISQFTGIGVSEDNAVKSALITIQHIKNICSPFSESLIQRTKNYLLCLIYGEEVAQEIHDLEQELGSLRNKMLYAEPGNCLSERKDEIEKQLKTLLDGIKKSHSK